MRKITLFALLAGAIISAEEASAQGVYLDFGNNLRPAGRMVSSAPPETTRPKTPARYHWSLQRLEPERQSPPIRGYLPAARKSPQTRDCVVVSRGFELRVRHPLISSPSLRHSELLGS